MSAYSAIAPQSVAPAGKKNNKKAAIARMADEKTEDRRSKRPAEDDEHDDNDNDDRRHRRRTRGSASPSPSPSPTRSPRRKPTATEEDAPRRRRSDSDSDTSSRNNHHRHGRSDDAAPASTTADPTPVPEPEVKRPRIDNDPQQRKRGQRMFGVLLGTLSKFKETTNKKTEAEIRREQLEQRLQEKLKKEHEELQERVRQDQETKRARIAAQRQEEARKRAQTIKETQASQRANLARYLRTKTEPSVFFLPATHNDATRAMLDDAWKRYLEQEDDARVRDAALVEGLVAGGEDGPVSAGVGEDEGKAHAGVGVGAEDIGFGADEEREGSVVGEVF
ncbi:hypothetical protein HDU96_004415 [Phlyctochytrium bullatum]|nr:hypothetical protein HDU96_004415 [Phlyctochytrium bullatum]